VTAVIGSNAGAAFCALVSLVGTGDDVSAVVHCRDRQGRAKNTKFCFQFSW
jgi:hypothetical protein